MGSGTKICQRVRQRGAWSSDGADQNFAELSEGERREAARILMEALAHVPSAWHDWPSAIEEVDSFVTDWSVSRWAARSRRGRAAGMDRRYVSPNTCGNCTRWPWTRLTRGKDGAPASCVRLKTKLEPPVL